MCVCVYKFPAFLSVYLITKEDVMCGQEVDTFYEVIQLNFKKIRLLSEPFIITSVRNVQI